MSNYYKFIIFYYNLYLIYKLKYYTDYNILFHFPVNKLNGNVVRFLKFRYA